jgi:alpha-glucosidase
METLQSSLWWQSAVIYQIYPRSFQDSNGDGVGDLAGILSRLDYLVELGVDALWISPFYLSPMADFGYDVADYCNVDPLFGSLADFDALIARAHELGLKLILDFVPNHTSDQHPWFQESRSSRDNPRRDWYLWRDPADGSGPPETRPPNNWMSHFGGPAWTYDEATGQFYMHSFLTQQPDLNWRNPEVRGAIYAAMRFWLDKGVDGFRMDVLWLLVKDSQFRNNPVNPDWRPGSSSFGRFLPLYTANRPETHEIVAEMRSLLQSYSSSAGDRLLIGEIYLPLDELVHYYGSSVPEAVTDEHDLTNAAITSPRLNGAQLPFNFHLIQTAWRADAIAGLISDYEAALPPGAWPNWVLGNHDQTRLATRIGPAQARVAAMLLLTLLALLAALPEAVSVLPAVPHLPLPDVPLRVCEPDGAADRAADRAVRHRAAARVSDRPVHPRRGPAVAPEEGRHADHGRRADLHLDPGADAAVERPVEPLVWLVMLLHAGFGAIGFADDYIKVVHKRTRG